MTCSKCSAEYEGEQCPRCAPAEPPKTSEPEKIAVAGEDQKPAATPQPPDDPNIKVKKEEEADAPPKPLAEFTDSKVRDFVSVSGKGHTVIGKQINQLNPSKVSRATLFDHLEDLPKVDAGPTPFDESELNAALQAFDKERLLLIVCSDRDYLREAGDALLARVKINQRRVLSFEGLPSEMRAEVHGLTQRSAKQELVVLVDAHENTEAAQLFVDSLFPGGTHGKLHVWAGLSRARVRVVCLTSEENVAGRLTRLEFGRWVVSAARLVLRKHFPSGDEKFEARINEQRKAGMWSQSPSEFRKQLEELILSGDLQSVLDSGGPLAEPEADTSPEREPPASPENVLDVAVLYAASYYPNLSVGEFTRIVELIVGDQRMLVPEKIRQKTKDGSFKTVELQHERRAAEVWAERTDATLRQSRLIASRKPGRAVTFVDVGRRDLLRRYFEEQYGAFAHRQFIMAWEKGLLFDNSSRVASCVILLTLDAAANDPEEFDRDWLCERILHFWESAENPTLVLRRFSELLRSMLRNPPLDTLVNGVIERFLQLGQHAYAFALVKGLRLAPEFDDLYWLQQILDRGTAEIRDEVQSYLFNELRRAGTDIHRYVATMEEKWLPGEDRDPDSYSPSNRAALVTLFAYCFEVTDGFEVDSYGFWPSRFPVLAVDRTFAAKQFSSLLRCLLHPGLMTVLIDAPVPETFVSEVATLLAKWVFILYGVAAEASCADDSAAVDFTRGDALTTLVEQILAVTKGERGRTIRQWLVEEWEWEKEIYLRAPAVLGGEGLERRLEFGNKRRLMHQLIAEFRRLQRAERRPASAPQATA